MKTRYEVQTKTVCDGWVNCWTDENEKPWTFSSRKEAQEELDEFLADVKEAVAAGDMQEEYDPNDYRIVPVKQ